MKKRLTVLCALVLALSCVFSLCVGAQAAGESEQTPGVVEWFANASNLANHYHGTFGGVTRVGDNSVRILAQKSSNSDNIGFMLTKTAVKSLIDAGHEVISFKVTTEAYGTNERFDFVNVYASDVNPMQFHCYPENGTRVGSVDLIFASGSIVKINLVKLYDALKTADGLKFVIAKTATGGAAGVPGYVVLSDFKSTKSIKTSFDQMASEESYVSYADGEFGGVSTIGENSLQILAKAKNGKAGVMLTKKAIEEVLLFRGNEVTVTLGAAAYDSGATPKYVVLEAPKAVEYVENYKTVAAKVDGNKLYFTPGTTITMRLEKIYPYITAENSLKFALLSGDSWENGGSAAYLTLSDLAFAEKVESQSYDLVCSNGDLGSDFSYETTWAKMTENSIRRVAEAGFKYIDLNLYDLRGVDAPANKKPKGWEDDLMKEGWEDIVLGLKELADELGIEFRLSHSPGYAGFGSAEWVAVNKRSIDICAMLGIDNLVVHSTVGNNKEHCYEVNATHYAKILPYAAERGINILCENSTMKNVPAGKWFFTTGADMRGLIELVQSQGYSNFHGVWDTGHANCEGSQYLDILAMADEIYATHFNDNKGDGDTHLTPYYGTMDVDEVMRALLMIGYSGDFTLETTGSKRMESGLTYTGPKLEGVEDYFPVNRFEQQKLVYKICTNILEEYDCASCETHKYSDWKDTGDGKHTRTCSVCGKTRLVNHTWDAGKVTKQSSCKEEGKKVYNCTTCGATKTETLAKTQDHSYTNACDTSCNTCGGIREVTHNYANATCTKAKTCKDCGATSGSALGHKYADATCTSPKTCTVCKATSGSALGHVYSNDCDKKCNRCYAERTVGAHKYTNACDLQCDSCGAWRAASHTYSNDCDKSCNVCGATRSVGAHKYSNACDTTCNTCGAKRTVTHDYASATCTKAKTCKVCGATSGSKLGHKYSNACDKSCNACGATRSVGAHKYDNDCDESCNICGAKRTVKHTYKTTTTKATLKKNGSVVKKCTECGEIESTKTIRKVKTVKLSKTSYTYNGKTKTPSVVVKDSAGKTLKKGTDYTVTYAKGRKTVGTYKVTIKFKGNYSGTKVLTFKITPPKTTLKKVTPANDALKISIDKETKQVTGYQVQYSTSKTFKNATTKTVKSYKTTSLTLKKLKSNKKYFVRVRTFKTVKGVKIYSGWSSYKTAKTK